MRSRPLYYVIGDREIALNVTPTIPLKMRGVRVPLYKVDNVWIDAYFIKYVEFKYNRVLMIRDKADPIDPQLKPVSTDELTSLIMDGYYDLQDLMRSVADRIETKRSIRVLEVLALPAYNPSLYLARRENEAVILPLLRMLNKLYEELINKIRSKGYSGIGSIEISLRNNKILVNGKVDRIYTNFYENDNGFRSKLDEILNAML